MTSGDKITITFVKNSAKDGSRYRKRTRTNFQIGKSDSDVGDETHRSEAADSTTGGDSSTLAGDSSTAVTKRDSTHKSSPDEVDDEHCLARNRPRRGPKPIERYEPQETVLDDDSGDSDSDC